MLFLVNPPRRKGAKVARKKKRTPPRGPGGRFRKKKKAVHRKKARKRTTRKRTVKHTRKRRAPVARKRARTTRRRRAHKRGKRTIRLTPVRGSLYRKNPGFNLKGIVGQVVDGSKRAVVVVGGKVGGRFVGNLLPLPKTTLVGNLGSQIVAALLIGIAGRRFLSRGMADDLFVGAMLNPVETGLKMVPGIGGLLGEYDPFLPMGTYDPFLPVGSYPQLPEGIESYPAGVDEGAEAALGY
jgi:hypothetical protein